MKIITLLAFYLFSMETFAQATPAPAPVAATGTKATWVHSGKDLTGTVKAADGFFLYYQQGTVTAKFDITKPADILKDGNYTQNLMGIPEIAFKENCLWTTAYYIISGKKVESPKSEIGCALIVAKPEAPKTLRIVD